MTGTVAAVCISPAKGTPKKNIGTGVFLEDYGIQGDAHAGKWHRQVSLLSLDKIREFRRQGAEVEEGAFGENLEIEGIDLGKLPVGIRLYCKDVILEITQIGKECHHGCQIFQKMGDCIMPREGVFARVIRGGVICTGDVVKTEETDTGEAETGEQ